MPVINYEGTDTNSKWNDDWREELKKDNYTCWVRLGDCRSTRKDIQRIAKLMYKYNHSFTKEECLDRTILWITDWNNQPSLCPDEEEYNAILESMR